MKINILKIALIVLLMCVCCCALFACVPAPTPTPPEPDDEPTVYNPGIIQSVYGSEEIMVADYVIGIEQGADPKGEKDSTAAIQKVLNECSENGGGTVFLPQGKYRVTSQILIPSFVYLRGDWNDPDGANFNGKYGTVILADVTPAETEARNEILADREDTYANFPALFRIGGSAALIGVTIYYPQQDASSVTPYPFAVEIPSFAGEGCHINHHASTVKNVTFINCYKGIIAGASASVFSGGFGAAFEQVHLENIKGTFLYQGMQLYIASEAGVVKDISISNKYWKNSNLGKVDANALDAYTMKYTTGMLLGDLEWLFFNDISISDVCMGVRIYDGIRRFFTNEVYFIGQFYNLQVRNTKTAMRIDNMYPNFGITIANSHLEGSVYSINERDKTLSNVKLVNTTLVGDAYGDSLWTSGIDNRFGTLLAEGMLASTKAPAVKNPPSVLFNVVTDYNADNTGATDCTQAIQTALDDARQSGGGIVYLPAGYYLIQGNLTVYENTELRGCAGAATRDQIGLSRGTVLLGDSGYMTNKSMAQVSTALVTLQGKNSGARGFRIIYPNNKPQPTANTRYKYHTYAVRILGEGSYLVQSSIVGVPYGIDISHAKNVVVSEVSGTFYEIGVNISDSENVYLDEILENAAVVCRIGYGTVPELQKYFLVGWPTDGAGLSNMYAHITRPNLELVKAINSKNISIVNTSVFGIKTFYHGINSEAKILACNSDNCSSYIWNVDGGSLYVVNMLKYNDTATYNTSNNGLVTAFNPLTLYFRTDFTLDPDVYANTPYTSVKVETTTKYVNDLPQRYTK